MAKKHDEWCTPPVLFEVLNEEFHFDLDAAATTENALCENYITAEMDALKVNWIGDAVFCNPPYTLIGPFVQRAYEQSPRWKSTTVVLIPAYTDPKYWTEWVMRAHEVRYLKGRLAFLENGKKKTSARFPSVVVVNKWIAGAKSGYAPHQWVWDWKAE